MPQRLVNAEGCTITVDPNDKWEDMTPPMILEACGYLPHWFLEYAKAPLDYIEETSIERHMDASYGFGLFEMTGGEIHEDYTYRYPEDPTLQPYIHIQANEGAEMIQWKFGMVAFRDDADSDWFMTRMD